MEKKSILSGLTKLIVILLIILISAISFLGVYKKNLNKWDNMLPDYNLSKELGEARTFGFEVSTATEEVELESEDTDKAEEVTNEESDTTEATTTEENATTDEQKDAEKPATTEVPVNNPEDLNSKNYKKVKSIVEKRLKDFGIIDEIVTIDETTGRLSIIVPQSRITDYSVALVTGQGKLEIINSDTKEVLINNNDISKVTAGYNKSATTADSKTYDLGISLQFTGEGQKKLNEISKTYVETTNEDGETSQKTVTVKLDGEDKYKTYFDPTGEYTSIFIPLFQAVDTEDAKTFNDNYNDCLVAESEINGGVLPIKYELTTGTYMSSYLGDNFTRNAVIVIAIILVVIALYILMKFGKKGLIIDIIELGFVAIMLLLIRAAGVSISLIGLVTILLTSILNYYLAARLIKNDKVTQFGKFLLNIFPLIIAIIVFVFATDMNVKSMGMVGFWSLIGYVYTFLVSLILLKNDKEGGADDDEE